MTYPTKEDIEKEFKKRFRDSCWDAGEYGKEYVLSFIHFLRQRDLEWMEEMTKIAIWDFVLHFDDLEYARKLHNNSIENLLSKIREAKG